MPSSGSTCAIPPRRSSRRSPGSSGSTSWPSRTPSSRTSGPSSTTTTTTSSCRAHSWADADDEATSHKTEIDAFIGDRWFITVRKDERRRHRRRVERWDRSADLAELRRPLPALRAARRRGRQLLRGASSSSTTTTSRSAKALFAEHPLDPASSATGSRRASRSCGSTGSWRCARRSARCCAASTTPCRRSWIRTSRTSTTTCCAPARSTDTLRDLVSTIVETNLTLRDFRQNQVMKQVTSWAAIIAVPTLITGYYGMNVKYPGLGSVWAAWVSLLPDGRPVPAPVPAVQEAGLALKRLRESPCS